MAEITTIVVEATTIIIIIVVVVVAEEEAGPIHKTISNMVGIIETPTGRMKQTTNGLSCSNTTILGDSRRTLIL